MKLSSRRTAPWLSLPPPPPPPLSCLSFTLTFVQAVSALRKSAACDDNKAIIMHGVRKDDE